MPQGDFFLSEQDSVNTGERLSLEPSREAGLSTLDLFLDGAGVEYRKKRNLDMGFAKNPFVSNLSPYIACGLVTSKEVIDRVLEKHSNESAGKFIQEIIWRSYWKGWLEHRPNLWQCYWDLLMNSTDSIQMSPVLGDKYRKTCQGQTDVAIFNSWVKELKETGYLHNHARMWFASIWIFTFELPWELGADFFYRHLLDGDPATNTLSWRWVAGLHTKGKTYLATKQNITQFAKSRLSEEDIGERGLDRLAIKARSIAENLPSRAFKLSGLQEKDVDYKNQQNKRAGLLLTEVDLSVRLDSGVITDIAGLKLAPRSPIGLSSEPVESFISLAIKSTLARMAADNNNILVEQSQLLSIRAVVEWAKKRNLDSVLAPYAPQGPAKEALKILQRQLLLHNIELSEIGNAYDQHIWPHSTAGFFQLNNRIPDILEAQGVRTGTS